MEYYQDRNYGKTKEVGNPSVVDRESALKRKTTFTRSDTSVSPESFCGDASVDFYDVYGKHQEWLSSGMKYAYKDLANELINSGHISYFTDIVNNIQGPLFDESGLGELRLGNSNAFAGYWSVQWTCAWLRTLPFFTGKDYCDLDMLVHIFEQRCIDGACLLDLTVSDWLHYFTEIETICTRSGVDARNTGALQSRLLKYYYVLDRIRAGWLDKYEEPFECECSTPVEAIFAALDIAIPVTTSPVSERIIITDRGDLYPPQMDAMCTTTRSTTRVKEIHEDSIIDEEVVYGQLVVLGHKV